MAHGIRFNICLSPTISIHGNLPMAPVCFLALLSRSFSMPSILSSIHTLSRTWTDSPYYLEVQFDAEDRSSPRSNSPEMHQTCFRVGSKMNRLLRLLDSIRENIWPLEALVLNSMRTLRRSDETNVGVRLETVGGQMRLIRYHYAVVDKCAVSRRGDGW